MSLSDFEIRLIQIYNRSIPSQDWAVYVTERTAFTDQCLEAIGVNPNEVGRWVKATDPRESCAKLSLTDSFFAAPEIEVQEVAKEVQIRDTCLDEAGRGITIKSTMETQINQPKKLRWGELEEDNGKDLTFLLPPRKVIGPDENGIKKVIEYEFDDDGNTVKIKTVYRSGKLATTRVSKSSVERRAWSKFVEAVKGDASVYYGLD